jgi:hypothetical protein
MNGKKQFKTKASQEFVPIKEIRDGVLVLDDNSLRMVIMVSSINFALKSKGEQEAIIIQYQNLLNSLDFSVQFLVQSRKLNIEPYLETLRKRQKEQTEELLKIQTAEYMDFIKEFVASTNIVNKNFYVVIPYTPTFFEREQNNPISNFLNKILRRKKEQQQVGTREKFDEYKIQLQQRADLVIQGLSRTGIRAAPLNTEELIELFYILYNPGEIEKSNVPGVDTNI